MGWIYRIKNSHENTADLAKVQARTGEIFIVEKPNISLKMHKYPGS